MEITDGFLVGISSLVIIISSSMLIKANYHRLCPAKKEVPINPTTNNPVADAKDPAEWA
jgi:hypothetical protein